MSVSEEEGPPELEFDMWEGQFEFVGSQFEEQDGNGNGGGPTIGLGGGTYDENVDLFKPRRRNGVKKHGVQLWYEDLAGHVSLKQDILFVSNNQLDPLKFSLFMKPPTSDHEILNL